MIKLFFDFGVNANLDSVRGIGVHNSQLLKNLQKIPSSRLKIVKSIEEADVLHISKFHPFFVSLPFFKGTKKIVLTIHDLNPLVYPKHFPPGIKGKINFLINKFLIWKNVDAVITISETSKKDICRFLGLKPEMVHVVYLAPRPFFKPITDKQILNKVSKKYNLPSKFALYIGDINYNKNIPTLIKACKKAKMPLVIAGKQALEIEGMDMNHAELRHLKNVDWSGVARLGYVEDSDLAAITNLATVYIQASLYEGFGLPVLEALACKTPVIAARTQALVEIAEEDCTFFDPKDVSDLAEKIKNFDRMKNEITKKFSWSQTAQQTLEVYEKI